MPDEAPKKARTLLRADPRLIRKTSLTIRFSHPEIVGTARKADPEKLDGRAAAFSFKC